MDPWREWCGSGMFTPVPGSWFLFIPDPESRRIGERTGKEKKYSTLTQKLSLSSQKDGFGIRDPEKSFSGSRIRGSKRHRSPGPDPQYCLEDLLVYCCRTPSLWWEAGSGSSLKCKAGSGSSLKCKAGYGSTLKLSGSAPWVAFW